jgi:alkanesulfonate monooxygenase SsuD/methylene tetrahydromethanopterin reductase-like flavin-dependent oxidoreductase (luciferase family)
VYIPGGGSIETWDFCLDHDYNYSYLSFTGYVRGKKLLDGYWERVAKRGKDESPYRAAFAQTICVAETDREAEELYAEHVSYFYNRCLHVYQGFADAPGYRTIKTIQANVLNALSEDFQQLFTTLSWKQLVDDGYIIAGSPETVRQRMEDLAKSLRVGHVFGLFHVGNMPDWKTRYSSQLFAERVMPRLRDVWPEWCDDDRWWCKPLPNRAHPEEGLEAARRAARRPQ